MAELAAAPREPPGSWVPGPAPGQPVLFCPQGVAAFK